MMMRAKQVLSTLALVVGLSVPAAAATITIPDGTYASLPSIANGTASDYTIVKAEHDGKVVITGPLPLTHTSQFIQFEGLRFESALQKNILGQHLKFLRDGFRGGPATDNNSNTAIGTNDFNDTADVLMEDCWFYGPGGRYDLLVYNANRVVLRRVVIRHDGGWTDSKGDPEAGVVFYNSSDSVMENVMVLDSNLTYHTWQSAFYNIYNTASPNHTDNNRFLGIISLNNRSGADGAGLRFDGNGPMSGHVIQDAILWDANWGLNLSYQAPVSVTATRLTIGGAVTPIGYGSSGTKDITDVRTTPPTYLPRREGSGASVEPAGLWPWPNEARIQSEMCQGVTRGFCADSSLTHYVWNYLGHGVPGDVGTPPTPIPTPTPVPTPTPIPTPTPTPTPPPVVHCDSSYTLDASLVTVRRFWSLRKQVLLVAKDACGVEQGRTTISPAVPRTAVSVKAELTALTPTSATVTLTFYSSTGSLVGTSAVSLR